MDPFDLTASILARTSGPACPRLRELACDYVDLRLPGPEARLVERHLAHCEACRAMLAALKRCHELLPAFASAEPGPWFATRVARACREAPGLTRWARFVERPRMALEGAFVGVALCALALAVPQGTGGASSSVKPVVGLVTKGLNGVARAVRSARLPPRTDPIGGSHRKPKKGPPAPLAPPAPAPPGPPAPPMPPVPPACPVSGVEAAVGAWPSSRCATATPAGADRVLRSYLRDERP
jgi:hypothetical protein